jgi:hypothetical protein
MNTKFFPGSVAGTKETLYIQNDIQFFEKEKKMVGNL